jgi:hypothetical protein
LEFTAKEREYLAEALVLLSTYRKSLRREDQSPAMDWFEAALPVAELVRKLGIDGEFGKARAHLPSNLVIGVEGGEQIDS